jgi:hypothetical protein
MPTYKSAPDSLGGGLFKGYSPVQTINSKKDSGDVMTRRVLRDSWNTAYANGTVNGKKRAIGPFRAVNNLGDFLNRQNYSCGGSNQVNADKPGWKRHIGSIIQHCDTTGVAASICNTRYVPDSSDYIKYKRQAALNRNYNDLSNGGDESNGSYVALMGARRR